MEVGVECEPVVLGHDLVEHELHAAAVHPARLQVDQNQVVAGAPRNDAVPELLQPGAHGLAVGDDAVLANIDLAYSSPNA